MYTKLILLLLSSTLLVHCTLANVSTERTHHRGTTPSSTSTTSTTHSSSSPTHDSLTSSGTVKNEATTRSTTRNTHHHEHHEHHDHSKDHSDTEPLEDNFFTHLKTIMLALQDFHYLTFSTLENAQFLFANVIADVTTTHDQKTEELKMKIKELTKFVFKVDRFRHSIKLLDDFTHALDSLNATAKEKPSAEDLIIDASLLKNKLEIMEQNFAHGYNSYGKRLAKELDTFEKSLSGKEQANDADVKAWIVEIKDLTKKIESYGEFFEKQKPGMHKEKSKA